MPVSPLAPTKLNENDHAVCVELFDDYVDTIGSQIEAEKAYNLSKIESSILPIDTLMIGSHTIEWKRKTMMKDSSPYMPMSKRNVRWMTLLMAQLIAEYNGYYDKADPAFRDICQSTSVIKNQYSARQLWIAVLEGIYDKMVDGFDLSVKQARALDTFLTRVGQTPGKYFGLHSIDFVEVK